MKRRKNEPPKIPPDKKLKYQFLHTAVSKGIRQHENCDYVEDTRNGFENIPEDTQWVAEYFMTIYDSAEPADMVGPDVVMFFGMRGVLRQQLKRLWRDLERLLCELFFINYR